ncbi:MAG: DUF2721 domain-containing protein [bacterium]|nr:DUF2721 domain-containing protein [bacterium]
MIELHYTFIPFMMGSIALIAYLSLRNIYLAKAARSLSADLQDLDDSFQRDSLIVQISWFLRRYRVSNAALISAIFSVVFFGLMIASSVVDLSSWLPSTLPSPQIIFLLTGGVFATVATMISIYEAFVARQSLFTAVGTAIATAKCDTVGRLIARRELAEIEKLIKKSVDSDLCDHLHDRVLTIQAASAEKRDAASDAAG